MAQNSIPLETGWEQIQTLGIDRLFEFLDTGTIVNSFDKKTYSELYTLIYNMCVQKPPYNYSDVLYERYTDTIKSYLTNIVYEDLNKRVGDDLLKEFNRRWQMHNVMVRWMRHFFQYLDRFYIPSKAATPLRAKGIKLFQTEIFEHFKSRVVQIFAQQMHLEREGMSVDRTLLKEVSGIFCQLGEVADSENQLYLYSYLETGLVEETANYYEQKSSGWIADDSCPEYLVKAENAFELETKRIEAYLHSSSEQKILDSFNDKVIVNHLHILLEKQTGIKYLLENHS